MTVGHLWGVIRQVGDKLIPPFPDLALLRPAVVPAATELDPDYTTPQVVQILTQLTNSLLYRRGMRGLPPAAYSKHACLLFEAALELRAYDYPPAAWIAYAFSRWVEMRARSARGAPLVPYVFGPKRFQSVSRLWFEEGTYCAARIEFGVRARALVVLWREMRHALVTTRAMTTTEISKIVMRSFPDYTGVSDGPGTWAQRVAAAQAEGRRRQAVIDAQVAAHEWVW